MRNSVVLLLVGAVFLGTTVSSVLARELTLEERVAAQQAVERAYYRHQLDARRSFEAAVPRALAERKVIDYLRESVALDRLWHTPVTARALAAEWERMVRASRLPERLREVHDALGNDPTLILECFVRPVLVNRLSRNFFAYDGAIHAGTRRTAAALRSDLEQGLLDPREDHPLRSVASAPDGEADPIGPLREERDAWRIEAPFATDDGRKAIAGYAIPKRSWEDWWSEVAPGLDASTVRTVSGEAALPSSTCAAADSWDPAGLDVQTDFTPNVAVWTGSLLLVFGQNSAAVPPAAISGGARYDPLTDNWSAISTENAPTKVLRAVWTGHEMLTWGQMDRYDPVANVWSPMSSVGAPSNRSGASAVWTGNKMIVWGGQVPGFVSFFKDGAVYDPTLDTWTPTTLVDAPKERADHSAVWTGSEMIVWGGNTTFGGSVISSSSTGARYNPVLNQWTAIQTSGAPAARRYHTAVWADDRMVVWGGACNNCGVSFVDVTAYDPVGNTWASGSTAGAPAARILHSAVWTGTEMIVWGGSLETGLAANTGARFNPNANSWTATSAAAAPAIGAPFSFWTGDRMLAWGQLPDGSGSHGGRYDPTSNTWTPMNRTPQARAFHTAVWTGTEMIVWGGRRHASTSLTFLLGNGGRYDPTTANWTETSTAGAPAPRMLHTAVWSGDRMIVWGGATSHLATGGPVYDTGGLYDPMSDTWSPAATDGAPSARAEHTAVWTGSEMVAWGGRIANNAVSATGSRYDPVANDWSPTAPAPVSLIARKQHTSVWTGEEMIVWGGWTAPPSSVTNGGARYNPLTDSWTEILAPGAVPVPRAEHAAVWTGSKMIIWGGVTYGSQPVNSGSLYDPAANVWTAMSALGAPGPRTQLSAVWTGGKAMIWGGHDGSTAMPGGAAYTVDTDGWTSVATAGAPFARFLHTAIWADREMLLWGGMFTSPSNQNGKTTGDGRAYTPDSDDDGVSDGCDNCRLLSNPSQTDVDSDGFGLACECDDAAGSVYPGAPELCDGLNNDCDEPAWPSVAGTPDDDSDSDTWTVCAGDCNDAADTVFPGAAESCNGVDDDCNLLADDGPDGDGDSVADPCDNCPALANLTQTDSDLDDEGDLCDADDGTVYLYLSDTETLDWQPEAGFDSWNVYSGDFAVLTQTGEYTQAPGSNLAARACGLATAQLSGLVDPAAGELAFFLASGVSGGVEGDLGTDSAGEPRPNTNPCP